MLTAASASQHSDNQMRRRRENIVVTGPVVSVVIAAVRCDVLRVGIPVIRKLSVRVALRSF